MTVPELAPPFAWDGDHVVANLPGGRALFTTRRGGSSEGPYASLNLGARTDDDPARVRANRRRLGELAGVGWDRCCHGHQVHGTTVRRADAAPPASAQPAADGQATALPGATTVVFVADCLPIVLVANGAVAALHGGWRGLAGGIVAEGVRALRDVGAAGPIHAALGPAARGCCYEVGEEVHVRFADYGARRAERNLDLAHVARAQLLAAGVAAVHDTFLCTICAPRSLFFSHRRDGGITGRQAGAAWRT